MKTGHESPKSELLRLALPLLIITLGAFLRFQAVQDTEVVAPLRSDAGQYVSYALNSLHHHTYSRAEFQRDTTPEPDSVRVPVYPMVIAAVFSGAPRAPLVLIQYLQAALSTAAILLAFLLFSHFLPPLWANVAALLVAISPHLIISNVYVLTESFFTFALLACLLTATYAYKRGGKVYALITGAAFGALTLTRTAVQYFIVLLAAMVKLEGKTLTFAMLIVVGFTIIFGAWSTRNIAATGSFSDNTLLINFLHHGMYPDFKYADQDDTYGFPYRHDPESPDISATTSSILYEIMNRFREEPVRHLNWFALGKPVVFWQWNMIQGMGDVYVYPVKSSPYFSRPLFEWTHAISKFLHTPIVILALLGSIFCWFTATYSNSRSAAFCVKLVAAMIIYYQLIHMIGAPFPRYSVPLRPLVYGMAAYFLYTAASLALGRRKE